MKRRHPTSILPSKEGRRQEAKKGKGKKEGQKGEKGNLTLILHLSTLICYEAYCTYRI